MMYARSLLPSCLGLLRRSVGLIGVGLIGVTLIGVVFIGDVHARVRTHMPPDRCEVLRITQCTPRQYTSEFA